MMAQPAANFPTYRFLGDITSHHFHGQRLELRCGQAAVRIELLAPELFRVRFTNRTGSSTMASPTP